MTSIQRILAARAAAMAAHDGMPIGAAHVHGASNQLQAELVAACDQLMRDPASAVAPQPEIAADIAPAPKSKASVAPAVQAEVEQTVVTGTKA